jgi:hypothetical protein
MIIVAVAFVVTAVVLAVVILGDKFRDSAFCPKRETVVEIVDGRCEFRATAACANAPLGCERECIKLGDFATRAA